MILEFSLDKKLIILVMAVSITSMSITGFLSFNYAEQILMERTSRQLFGESTIRGEALKNLFESRIEQNKIITTNSMIQILVSELNQTPRVNLPDEIEEKHISFISQINSFQELIGSSNEFEDIKIIGKNGDVFFSLVKTEEDSFQNESLFRYGLKSSFVTFEFFQNSTKMITVSPIFAKNNQIEDEFIGVVISKMGTEEIDNIVLNRSGLGETGEIYFASKDFLMSSESKFIENSVFIQMLNSTGIQKCFNEETDYQGLFLDYREVLIYGSSYCASDLGFVLLAKIDQAETIQPILTLQGSIFETGMIITLIMAGIAFIISKTLSKPLIKLKNAADTIAKGNFDVRTEIATRDEIGQLSMAFDSMAQKLQESLIEIKQKEDVIKEQENILLQFSEFSEKYCVCMIDIMNSTKITSKLSDAQTSEFYKIFLNSMALIVQKFNGTVVKNIGDALLFYFPVINSKKDLALMNCLNCCLALGESHEELEIKLQEKDLPIIDYRTSATFGMVRIAKTSTSSIHDIFGTTVNRCAKINRFAPANALVVDEEFYKNVKTLDNFIFKKVESEISSTELSFIGYIVYRARK